MRKKSKTKYKVNITHPVVSTRLPVAKKAKFDRYLEMVGKTQSEFLFNAIMAVL